MKNRYSCNIGVGSYSNITTISSAATYPILAYDIKRTRDDSILS
jgi:hypothetical protein